jgi:hypothetical protein
VDASHTKAVQLCKEAALRGHVGAADWLLQNGYTAWAKPHREKKNRDAQVSEGLEDQPF